jgi:hypothetical protein
LNYRRRIVYTQRTMNAASGNTPGTGKTHEFLSEFLAEFDLPQFLEALPVDEFSRLLKSLDERIEHREGEAAKAQADAERMRGEKSAILQALVARERLLEAREREQQTQTDSLPALSPRRKRAAVLQAIEDNPGEPQSPASVRAHLARAGLLDPNHETGTPVRIILAQMTEAGTLERVGPGKYRLRTRAERLALAGADQE